jgi:uncharacterized protein YuzE
MKLHVDPAQDALYLKLTEAPVVESEEKAPGVVLDFDAKGNVVGIEVRDLARRDQLLTEVEVGTQPA